MKSLHLVQVIDLRFQNDHINCRKTQLFEDYRGNSHIARRIPTIFL